MFIYLHVKDNYLFVNDFYHYLLVYYFFPVFFKCSTVLRPWFGIRVIDVKEYRKLVSNPGKELDASNRDLSVSVKEVTY